MLPDFPRLPNHFTASAVVISRAHILLVHHRRIAAWLPPGGHIEPCELPHEAAVREVLEETGVHVEVLSEKMPVTNDPEAFFLQSPLCLHAVAAVENQQQVFHVDIAYLCRPVFQPGDDRSILPSLVANEEVLEARWIKMGDLPSVKLAKNVKEAVALAMVRLRAGV